jgi:hypothetical protein
MPALLWQPHGHTTVGVVRISVRTLMHVLDQDPKVGDCPGNGLHMYCLTRMHATNRVIVSSVIYNMDLVCGEGTRLDCYDMISTTARLA